MNNRFAAVCLGFAFLLGAASGFAKTEEPQDGVKVGKPSVVGKLVPQKQVEAMALRQYEGLKSQANQRGMLAQETDPQAVRLRRIANELIPHAKRWSEYASQWKWEVNLIASNQINAFCMPGGKIVFFHGILNKLKLTDDEVAIVMGHEMAHALREHARERLAKGIGLRLGAAVTSSVLGLGDLGQFAVDKSAHLLMLKFSRSNETDADLVGLDIAARAGYDPRAGVALWQKMGMQSRNAPIEWFSTHPAGDSRISEMRKHLPEVMPLYARSKGKSQQQLEPYRSNVAGIAPIN